MSWNDRSTVSQVSDLRDERVTAFLGKVYGWMFVGLLITAGVAYSIASSDTLLSVLVGNRLLVWVAIPSRPGVCTFSEHPQNGAIDRGRSVYVVLSAGRRDDFVCSAGIH